MFVEFAIEKMIIIYKQFKFISSYWNCLYIDYQAIFSLPAGVLVFKAKLHIWDMDKDNRLYDEK